MEPNPRVSIVIPVYNGSNFLREAIDSALAQTYRNLEVLVVDDGSQDGGKTCEIARSYGSRIRYLLQDHGGVASALNAGIREMTGQYFSWLSHDDVYSPSKIERQLRAIVESGEEVIAYSDYELIDHRSRTIKRKVLRDIGPAEFRFRLILETALHGCSMLIPKSCFARELFNERLFTTQDYDMWFRLARNYRFIRVPEILLKYRIHPHQESWRNRKCIEEGNCLILGFLRELSPEEIRRFTSEPLSSVYAGAALRIKLRGFTEAARYALDLSDRYVRSRAERLAPKRLALLALYPLADPRIKPMYWWKRFHFRSERPEVAR